MDELKKNKSLKRASKIVIIGAKRLEMPLIQDLLTSGFVELFKNKPKSPQIFSGLRGLPYYENSGSEYGNLIMYL